MTRDYVDVLVGYLESVHDAHAQPWRERAACRAMGWELFYGQDVTSAREVCARCPVQQECGDWALSHPETRGVWGGMSQREQRPLRMLRRR